MTIYGFLFMLMGIASAALAFIFPERVNPAGAASGWLCAALMFWTNCQLDVERPSRVEKWAGFVVCILLILTSMLSLGLRIPIGYHILGADGFYPRYVPYVAGKEPSLLPGQEGVAIEDLDDVHINWGTTESPHARTMLGCKWKLKSETVRL